MVWQINDSCGRQLCLSGETHWQAAKDLLTEWRCFVVAVVAAGGIWVRSGTGKHFIYFFPLSRLSFKQQSEQTTQV